MKKILYPTDFSENADNALRYVIPFAQRMNAEVIMLHVFPFPAVYAEAPLAVVDTQTETLRKAAMEQLTQLRAEIRREAPELNCEYLAVQGPVVGHILTMAEERAIDWIVMGTHGRSGLEKMIFGTVTAQVIAEAKCPVLGVPDIEFFHGIKRIAFATDFRDNDLKALETLAKIATAFGSEIHVVHVCDAKAKAEEIEFENYKTWMESHFKYPKTSYFLIRHSDFQIGLEEFIEEAGVDMLAMNPQRRNLFQALFHGSQTKKMAYHAKRPLLALHV